MESWIFVFWVVADIIGYILVLVPKILLNLAFGIRRDGTVEIHLIRIC